MERVTNEGRVQLGPLLRYLEPNAWKARMRTPTGTDNLEVAANLSAQHGTPRGLDLDGAGMEWQR